MLVSSTHFGHIYGTKLGPKIICTRRPKAGKERLREGSMVKRLKRRAQASALPSLEALGGHLASSITLSPLFLTYL